MFENVGKKLKSISVVLFWIEMIAALIAGIVVWSISYDLGFLWFLLIAVGGGIYAYISALMMYALGEAAENSTEIMQKISEFDEKEKRGNINEVSVQPVVKPAEQRQFTNLTKNPTHNLINKYQLGQIVTHKQYGTGKIVIVSKEDVIVKFDNGDRHTFDFEKIKEELSIIN